MQSAMQFSISMSKFSRMGAPPFAEPTGRPRNHANACPLRPATDAISNPRAASPMFNVKRLKCRLKSPLLGGHFFAVAPRLEGVNVALCRDDAEHVVLFACTEVLHTQVELCHRSVLHFHIAFL